MGVEIKQVRRQGVTDRAVEVESESRAVLRRLVFDGDARLFEERHRDKSVVGLALGAREQRRLEPGLPGKRRAEEIMDGGLDRGQRLVVPVDAQHQPPVDFRRFAHRGPDPPDDAGARDFRDGLDLAGLDGRGVEAFSSLVGLPAGAFLPRDVFSGDPPGLDAGRRRVVEVLRKGSRHRAQESEERRNHDRRAKRVVCLPVHKRGRLVDVYCRR